MMKQYYSSKLHIPVIHIIEILHITGSPDYDTVTASTIMHFVYAYPRIYNCANFEFEFVYSYALAGAKKSKATNDTVTAFRGR
jgi:hypothetical protein